MIDPYYPLRRRISSRIAVEAKMRMRHDRCDMQSHAPAESSPDFACIRKRERELPTRIYPPPTYSIRPKLAFTQLKNRAQRKITPSSLSTRLNPSQYSSIKTPMNPDETYMPNRALNPFLSPSDRSGISRAARAHVIVTSNLSGLGTKNEKKVGGPLSWDCRK